MLWAGAKQGVVMMNGLSKNTRQTVWRDHPLRLDHPFRLLVIGVVLLMCSISWVTYPREISLSAWVAMGVGYVLSLLAYWYPVHCSLALIVLVSIGEYAIPGFDFYDSWFLYLAMPLVAYETTNTWTVATWAYLSLFIVSEHLFKPWGMSFKGVVAYSSCFMLLGVAGAGLRWTMQRTEQLRSALRAQSQLRVLEFSQRTALQLHDQLSQRLAVISMAAQHHVRQQDGDSEDWAFVDETSREALESLRTIIALLGEPARQKDEVFLEFDAQLRQELKDSDALLHNYGFHGSSKLESHHAPETVPSSIGTLLLMTVHELYTNITKHADPGVKYRMRVRITSKSMQIVSINGIHQDQEREQPKLPGGNGLTTLTKAIHDIGGTVEHRVLDDGLWQANVELPLTTEHA